MIKPHDFVQALEKRGFRSFTGVPCSFFQAAINFVIHEPGLDYTIAPNEGAALALASGAYLAGRRQALFIQNSGFGNLVNPLTSLNMIYGIPALIFMSGRAYGVSDEPQHKVMGRAMGPLLKGIGVPYADLPDELAAYQKALDRAVRRMDTAGLPFVFLVKKGTLEEYRPAKNGAPGYPLKRIDAIKIFSKTLKGDEYVVATTGKPSRELFSVRDSAKHFYMQGSMGHAASIGLGLALSDPKKKVVVLDGDGAVLMHMGSLSSVGHHKPKNFYHVVLDNESYETTGDQDTTSSTTDFEAVARACGYAWTARAASEHELKSRLSVMLSIPGPCFLRVKVNRAPTDGIPRISSRHSSGDIMRNFKTAFEKGR